MAIHHIINDYNLAHGGAQRLVLDLHKGGLDEGLSSKLLGLSKSPIYNIQSARSLHYQSVYKLIIFIKLWRYFKEEVNAGDIVHVHLFPSILYVSLLSIFKLLPKCKLILTEHSTSNKRRNKLWGKWVDYLTYKSYHKIIAISKTFSLEHIMPLIELGHNHFGENKVQEAETKWSQIKKEKNNLRLHMVGKLQSNKAKKAVEVFDYIHSLESQKLADTLSKCQNDIKKSINYFIQVNIGNESQKAGIQYNEVDQFYNYCTREKKMNVIGLMAIPPNDENTEKYFKSLSELNSSLGLKELSMGMSSDFMKAINYKSTYLRIGSAIFGERS